MENEERVEYYGITDPPGWTVPDELKPSILELLRLQRKEQKYRWVSVKDKLPEEVGFYLVYMPKVTGHMEVSFYSAGYGWDTGIRIYKNDMITYWMPLPAPPE